MTWKTEIVEICQLLKARQAERTGSNRLTFGDSGLGPRGTQGLRKLIGEIAPSLIITEPKEFEFGRDDIKQLFDPNVGRANGWIRGFVWTDPTYRKDPDGEWRAVPGLFDVGVSLELHIPYVDEKGYQQFAENYSISYWDTEIGGRGKGQYPTMSVGVHVAAFTEMGYDGHHIGSKRIKVKDAERYLALVRQCVAPTAA